MVDMVRADQRLPDHGILPPPLTWDYAKRLRRKDGRYVAGSENDLVDSTCLHRHTCILSARIHRIAPDGTVMPSYVCPSTGCSFHTFVRLIGWDPSHVFEIIELDF